ncbi:penicillin acylase family protein [Pseudoalteromonas luteoviolacea]|uniref:Penicillin amidase n=1 Tax=Pseudoalteromonas luteoviolacea S4060-1 TaxID=1365257 RepID=A0A162BV40_9GAMM|nr:penicillin acylase family protein [Pseudoalteromonas luteoviolacea]KZN69019.1 hypothetical protein N478_12615 [Pseudoalteromonas luteoviolacea S4060-1]
MLFKSIKRLTVSFPLMTRSVMCILAIVGVSVCGLIYYSNNALKPLSGKQTSSFVQNNVQLGQDVAGLSYVNAATDLDAYFGTGVLHARDRMWQMEFMRRMARGTLSEVFGKSYFEQDVWFRTLGLIDKSKQDYEQLSAEAQASLRAYAAGVNHMMERTGFYQPEFYIFDVTPDPWLPSDSLSILKLLALELGNDYAQELEALLLSASVIDPQKKQFFFNNTAGLKTADVDLPTDALLASLSTHRQRQTQMSFGHANSGSNIWLIAGKHTETGRPLLANDPHLGLQIPSPWYSVHQKGKNLEVTGQTLVGLPLVIFGHNKKVGWGATNMMADVQDLVLEVVNPRNSAKYLYDNQWQDFALKEHTIKVKKDAPIFIGDEFEYRTVVTRSTQSGPVITDLIGHTRQTISLQWSSLNKKDTTYEAFYRLSYANTWQSFKDSLSYAVAPALNMFYIDSENIGFQAIGAVPVREHGSYGSWLGYIPYQDMPAAYNPDSGILVNANNANMGSDYPYYISKTWADDARYQHITNTLKSYQSQGEKLSKHAMLAMQLDTFNSKEKAVLGSLLQVLSKHSSSSQSEYFGDALKALKSWDGRADEGSVGATIFYAWIKHLKIELYEDEFNLHVGSSDLSGTVASYIDSITIDELASTLMTERVDWCNNLNTVRVESCSDVVFQSLENGLKEIESFAGSDISKWHWGEVQTNFYGHNIFRGHNIISSIFSRERSGSGFSNSINVSAPRFDLSLGYINEFGASFRQIISFVDEKIEYSFINSTGQSGNVLSDYYDNMLEDFAKNHQIQFSHTVNNQMVIEKERG